MIRALFILALLSASVVAQEARIVEKLADGSFIVAIGSIEYRALPPAKVAELEKQKKELEATKQINVELGIQIKEALLQRDLAQAQRDLEKQKADSFKADFERAQEDARRNFGLFIGERTLRQEAAQFVPHGNKTKFDKFLTLFDSKAMQFAIKGFAPIWTAVRCQ